MLEQNPIDVSKCDLKYVFHARHQNDIGQLQNLFKDVAIALQPSKEIEEFFLKNSRFDIFFDSQNLQPLLQRLTKPLLFRDKLFSSQLMDMFPEGVALEVKQLLEKEMATCFEIFFTLKGELQFWVVDIFEAEQLESLYQQFGQVAVKFELFRAFFNLYCEVLGPPMQIPCDEAWSQVLNMLMQHELSAYQSVIERMISLESTLRNAEDTYKLKAEAIVAKDKLEEGIFSNRLLFIPHICELIESFQAVIKAPAQMSLIHELKQETHHLMEHPSYYFWFDVLAVVNIFCASLLLVGGGICLFASTGLPLALLMLAVGSLLLGGGIGAFQAARPAPFFSFMENFSEHSEMLLHPNGP